MAAPKGKGRGASAEGEVAPKRERKVYDWESIEVAYCAGLRSVLAIAKEYGCTEGAIRKRAKEHGWQRDDTEKLKIAVRAKLSARGSTNFSTNSGTSTNPGTNPSTNGAETSERRADALNHEVELRAAVIEEHRALAAKAQAQIRAMLAELEHANTNQDDDEAAIREECKDDKNGLRRSRMLQSVSLPSRSGVIVNLANAMVKLGALERGAWGLDDAPPPSPPDEVATTNARNSVSRKLGRIASTGAEGSVAEQPDPKRT